MFLTVEDVANQLQISRSLVYQIIETGKLAYHRIGTGRGAIRVSEKDLGDYLESCRKEKAETAPKSKPPRSRLKHLKL